LPENLATGVCFCDNEYEPDENLWINKYHTFTPLHLACIAGISMPDFWRVGHFLDVQKIQLTA